MFYDKFVMLCSEKGVKPSRVAAECTFNKSSISAWKAKYEKGEDVAPTTELLKKLSEYFGISIDFLLGRPPFDAWDLVVQNPEGFFYYLPISDDILKVVWGIDKKDPKSAPLVNVINFFASCIKFVSPGEDGDWEIELTDNCKMTTKNGSTISNAAGVTEDDIKVALFGGANDVTPEMWEEVKNYAAYLKSKYAKG